MRSIEDWQVLVGRATSSITQRFSDSKLSHAGELDGLLFFGNPHETVPTGLLLDEYLGAVDVLGWQMIRLMTEADRSTAFPTYDQLQPLLRASPGTSASRGTVARVIAVLRLTRWMSLCHKARHDTGRIMGNVYALHDEPLSFEEAALLDSDYNAFVVQCLSHNNSSVRFVAERVHSAMKSGGQQTRLNQRAQRFVEMRDQRRGSTKQDRKNHQSPSENSPVIPGFGREPSSSQTENRPSSQRELSSKSMAYGRSSQVRSENQANTVPVRNGIYLKTSTGTEADPGLIWHEQLRIAPQERQELLAVLQRLGSEVAQAVLDETAGRVLAGKVRTPKGLLRSLIKSAQAGEFVITRYAENIRDMRCGEGVAIGLEVEARHGSEMAGQGRSQPATQLTQAQAAASRKKLLDSLGLRR